MIKQDELEKIQDKYKNLENELNQSVNDKDKYVSLSKEYADLKPLYDQVNLYLANQSELEELNSVINGNDADLIEIAKSEINNVKEKLLAAENVLKELMIPKDPLDKKNVILEVRAGTGGDEAALFANDLLRMYQRYAENQGWKIEYISISDSEKGGIKEAVAKISGSSVYSKLKFESGVHRVQRVPETESQGRVHTSAASVVVLPEAEDLDIQVDDKDIRVDVFRSSGAGGQHVNTTDSAVRITHLPSKIVVQCQNERSQHKNKETCMNMLRARLYDFEIKKKEKENENTESSKSEIGWGHQIRSYVLQPYRLVKDNRSNFESSNPDKILDGEIDEFLEQSLYQT